MTKANSDYIAALMSWRNNGKPDLDTGTASDHLRFRQTLQREMETNTNSTPHATADLSDDNDPLVALQQLVNPSDGRDISTLSALANRGANTTRPHNGHTRQKVTITGAADSLSKAGLGDSITPNTPKMMDVSTVHNATQTAHTLNTTLARLHRQRNKMLRSAYEQNGTLPDVVSTDDAMAIKNAVVKNILQNTPTAQLVYSKLDMRAVRHILR